MKYQHLTYSINKQQLTMVLFIFALIWLTFCLRIMRRIRPCGRWPEVITGLSLLAWTAWTIKNYERVPPAFLLLFVFLPIVFVFFLPRITDFIHYDKATGLEYRGELRGNALAVAGKWVAVEGTVQIRQFNQGVGSVVVQTFALRKNRDVWVKCSANTKFDADIDLHPELLATFDRVENRVNKWRMFRVTWRPGS